MGRRPKDWKPELDTALAQHGLRRMPASVPDDPSVIHAFSVLPVEPSAPVFGGVVSPAPEVINTVQANEPITEPAESMPFDENEPGRWIPGMASFDDATKDDPEWLGSPSISIRAGLTAAIANPGPWPNAERLGRAQRHMEELINALPEAIEAATGLLKEDLETLRDILA
jgi:hypothetical protein